MPKLPTLTAQKFIKAIKKDGFTLDRSRGSHQTFLNPDSGFTESEFIQLL